MPVKEYSAELENDFVNLLKDDAAISLTEGNSYQLTANIKDLSYISENSDIASVDSSGTVTAVSIGETRIKVTGKNGREAFVTINVYPSEEKTEEICNRSINDYAVKTGIVAADAVLSLDGNNCVVELKDKDGNILDTYTVSPYTQTGVNSAGKEVNLPQTGNNNPNALLSVILGLLMSASGFFALKSSGKTKKRKNG